MGNQIFLPHSEAVGGPQALIIHCDAGEVSDGYHTFNELYEHRCLLFCLVSQSCGASYKPWKSRRHHDGSEWEGWFIAGMSLGGEAITYHLPERHWNLFYGEELDQAPPWDGHTSQDVIERLKTWCDI